MLHPKPTHNSLKPIWNIDLVEQTKQDGLCIAFSLHLFLFDHRLCANNAEIQFSVYISQSITPTMNDNARLQCDPGTVIPHIPISSPPVERLSFVSFPGVIVSLYRVCERDHEGGPHGRYNYAICWTEQTWWELKTLSIDDVVTVQTLCLWQERLLCKIDRE